MAEEAKTLKELLAILTSIAPQMDEVAANILKEYPDLLKFDPSKGISAVMLGRFLGIAHMDFLCFAFGKPDLGYIKAESHK